MPSSLPSRSATPNSTSTGLSVSASTSNKAADDKSTIEKKEESTNSPGMDQSIDSTTNSTSAKQDVDTKSNNNADLPTDTTEHTVPPTGTSLSLAPSIERQSIIDGCGVTASSWFSSWFVVGSANSPAASSPTKPVAPPDNAANLSVSKTRSRSSSSCKDGSSVLDKKNLVEGEDTKEDDMVPAIKTMVSNGSSSALSRKSPLLAAAASAQEEDESKSSVPQQLEVAFNNSDSGIHSNASTKAEEDKSIRGKDETFGGGATSPSSSPVSLDVLPALMCEQDAAEDEEANAIASVVTSSTKHSRASRFSSLSSAVLPKTMATALSRMAGSSKRNEEVSSTSLGSQNMQKQKQTKTELMTQEQYMAAMEERDDDDTQEDVESCDVDAESRTLESSDVQSVSSTLPTPRRRLATRTEKAAFVLSTVLFIFIFIGIADTLRRQSAENTNATGAIEYTQENLPVLNTSVFFETEYNPAVVVDVNNTSESSSSSSVEEEEYNPVNETVVLDENATEAASEIVIIPHVPADEYVELDEEKVDERTGEDWYPGLGGGGNGIGETAQGGGNNPCPDGRKLVLVDDDGETTVENVPRKKKYLRDSGKNASKERYDEENKQRILETKTGKCMKVGDSNTVEEEILHAKNNDNGNVGLTAASNTHGDSKAAKEHPNN